MAVTNFTKNMMSKFPSWMKLAKDPDSIGAQFLDVFGLTFYDIKKELDDTVSNFYINTANTEMIDFLYRIPLAQETVLDHKDIDVVTIHEKDGYERMVYSSKNLRDFYHKDSALPKFYTDRESGYLYLRVNFEEIEDINYPFESVSLNEAKHFELEIHHVWNAFDEFGLLLGLKRLAGERNEAFKNRILNVFKKPGNSTKQGLRNGIARELGLSNDLIKTKTLDTENVNTEFIKRDGTPTEKLMRYAKRVNDSLKFTWDNLNFGEAYWFSIEQENLGIHYLPHVWDVDTNVFKKTDFQSGIGSGDDLKVTGPKELDSTRNFSAFVSLIGYYEDHKDVFPEIEFKYKIQAQGKVIAPEYQNQPFAYTVKATEIFNQDYSISAKQDFDYLIRTEFENKNSFDQTRKTNKNSLDQLQFGKSNDFLHNQKDPVLRLGVELKTESDTQTNRIPELNIIWEDTAGLENSFKIKTSDDFLVDKTTAQGMPLTNVYYSDVSYNATEGLGLGYGSFQHSIDTTTEWEQGNYETNSILINNGGIQLNLDYMGKLQN